MSRVDSVGTTHACSMWPLVHRDSGYSMAECEARSFSCGCTPVLHRFKCARCYRWVGWCMGCSDKHPEWCDDCWSQEEEVWL